jgi:2-C-methyl-D-erythritol 4-phosphate cytidylyltransferase
VKKFALIAAGGNGSRMGSDTPKQFIEVAGKPILLHTINKFLQAVPDIDIVLVLPEKDSPYWKEIVRDHQLKARITVVNGGETRLESVRKGLSVIESDGLVAIHDAVRPMINVEVIRISFIQAEKFGSAIATVPLKDSIRRVKENISYPEPRTNFRLVQTPQTFEISKIKNAYNMVYNKNLTDDASVFQEAGFNVHLIEGNPENIKITTPEDLIIANAFLQTGQS